mmetsp:Transcript_15514/g.60681  ORF Transcript_15514/g.60681 Transcript_15514/m.60681 type:complete len:659 (+) Transcript_15514:34-2010(+)
MPILGLGKGKKKKAEKKRKVGPTGPVATRQSSATGVHPAQVEEEERKARLAQASEDDNTEEKVTVDVPVLCRAEAICAYEPDDFEVDADITFLRFETGQHIDVIEQDESGWWEGIIDGIAGIFPGAYVRVVEIYGAEDGAEPVTAFAAVSSETAADLSMASSTDADPQVSKRRSTIGLNLAAPPAAPEELEDAELARLASGGAFGNSSHEPSSEDLPGLEDAVAMEEQAGASDPDEPEPQHPAPEPPVTEEEPSREAEPPAEPELQPAEPAEAAEAPAAARAVPTSAPSQGGSVSDDASRTIAELQARLQKQEQAHRSLAAQLQAAEKETASLRAQLKSKDQQAAAVQAGSSKVASLQEQLVSAHEKAQRLQEAAANEKRARASAEARGEELVRSLASERKALQELQGRLAAISSNASQGAAAAEAATAAQEEAEQSRAAAAAARAELEEVKKQFGEELQERLLQISTLTTELDEARKERDDALRLRADAEAQAEEHKKAVLVLKEAAASVFKAVEGSPEHSSPAHPPTAQAAKAAHPKASPAQTPPVQASVAKPSPAKSPPAQAPRAQAAAVQAAPARAPQAQARPGHAPVQSTPPSQKPAPARTAAQPPVGQPPRGGRRPAPVARGMRRPAPPGGRRLTSTVPAAIAARPLPSPPK